LSPTLLSHIDPQQSMPGNNDPASAQVTYGNPHPITTNDPTSSNPQTLAKSDNESLSPFWLQQQLGITPQRDHSYYAAVHNQTTTTQGMGLEPYTHPMSYLHPYSEKPLAQSHKTLQSLGAQTGVSHTYPLEFASPFVIHGNDHNSTGNHNFTTLLTERATQSQMHASTSSMLCANISISGNQSLRASYPQSSNIQSTTFTSMSPSVSMNSIGGVSEDRKERIITEIQSESTSRRGCKRERTVANDLESTEEVNEGKVRSDSDKKPIRLPGPCTNCRKVKMRCEFSKTDDTACKRCHFTGSVCIIEERKSRTHINGREHLQAQLRHKKQILLKIRKINNSSK